MTPIGKPMTLHGKIMFALHALVLIGCVRAGSLSLAQGLWRQAVALFVIALVSLVSLFREISRAECDEEPAGTPQWLRRMRRSRDSWCQAHPARTDSEGQP